MTGAELVTYLLNVIKQISFAMRLYSGIGGAARCCYLLCVLLRLVVQGANRSSFTYAADAQPDLLFVFEYDGTFDWQRVCFDEPSTSDAVSWMLALTDRLTQSPTEPLGTDLMVNSPLFLRTVQP